MPKQEAELARKAAEQFRTVHDKIKDAVQEVIVGQEAVIEAVLAALFVGGHVLLEGVPGLGKTILVRSLGEAVEMAFSRIQFTPDMMPADIQGTSILVDADGGGHEVQFQQGPLVANLVLADEINRATPKTQSALLEAMQEKQISIGKRTIRLEEPYCVLATQNPVEQEGTYPLPEAQLDRFFMEIDVGYPDLAAERRMLFATTGGKDDLPQQVLGPEDLMQAQALVRRMPVGDHVVNAILKLVRSARPELSGAGAASQHLSWGPGPRASQAFMLAIRAKCLLEGRHAPSVEDVATLAHPVLKHRMALTFAARADGVTTREVIARLCENLD